MVWHIQGLDARTLRRLAKRLHAQLVQLKTGSGAAVPSLTVTQDVLARSLKHESWRSAMSVMESTGAPMPLPNSNSPSFPEPLPLWLSQLPVVAQPSYLPEVSWGDLLAAGPTGFLKHILQDWGAHPIAASSSQRGELLQNLFESITSNLPRDVSADWLEVTLALWRQGVLGTMPHSAMRAASALGGHHWAEIVNARRTLIGAGELLEHPLPASENLLIFLHRWHGGGSTAQQHMGDLLATGYPEQEAAEWAFLEGGYHPFCKGLSNQAWLKGYEASLKRSASAASFSGFTSEKGHARANVLQSLLLDPEFSWNQDERIRFGEWAACLGGAEEVMVCWDLGLSCLPPFLLENVWRICFLRGQKVQTIAPERDTAFGRLLASGGNPGWDADTWRIRLQQFEGSAVGLLPLCDSPALQEALGADASWIVAKRKDLLLQALSQGSPGAVQLLLGVGGVCNQEIEDAAAQATASVSATDGDLQERQIRALRCLLERVGPWPHTWRGALRSALNFGHCEAETKLLLEAGVDVRGSHNGITPVLSVCARLFNTGLSKQKAAGVLRLLLEAGGSAQDALPSGCGGSSSLHLAVAQQNAEMVDLLLAHGADPAARDAQGRRPVDCVVSTGEDSLTERIHASLGGGVLSLKKTRNRSGNRLGGG